MKLSVSRSIQINAPLEQVKLLVEDFHHWQFWSPWAVLEPEAKIVVSGVSGEPDHSMTWDGQIIGAGKNTLVENSETSLSYSLQFTKPWKSQANTHFRFSVDEDVTTVTWVMESGWPLFLFFMLKTTQVMIGMDYDRGLKMLKEVAEKGELKCQTLNAGEVTHQGFDYVGIKREVHFDDIAEYTQKDFEKIVNDIVIQGQKSAEHWVCIYPKFNMKKQTLSYIAAISSEQLSDLPLDDTYIRGRLESGKCLEIKHNGAYDFIGNAWSMGHMFLRAKKIKQNHFPFEQYWNSPFEVAPHELMTSIYFPIK